MIYLPAEFPQNDQLAYLNHAAVGPWPKRSAEAVQRFAFENMTQGASGYLDWMEVQQALREKLAWLINAASSDDIALVKNTSEGLSFVASGLAWQPGDEIVGIANDFPSNRLPWESLESAGVQFKAIDTLNAADPTDALITACGPKTRLLAVSSAHFAKGTCLDLQRLSQFARNHEILLCVDAIQTLGAVPFDLQKTPADFVVADGHKWMLGPEGLGLLYVNPALRDQLKLTQFGWAMRENAADYSGAAWQPANSARRFECGSPNMIGIHALNASLSLFQELGMETVQRSLQEKVAHLRNGLASLPGCTIHTPESASGILAFSMAEQSSQALYQGLMAEQVICAQRGDWVRFSPHFYTRLETIDLALERLSAISAKL